MFIIQVLDGNARWLTVSEGWFQYSPERPMQYRINTMDMSPRPLEDIIKKMQHFILFAAKDYRILDTESGNSIPWVLLCS